MLIVKRELEIASDYRRTYTCIPQKILGGLFSVLFLWLCIPGLSFGSPLYSEAWGFYLDLPEDYEYTGGDGKDKFSFGSQDGASLDLAVYASGGGAYASVNALAQDVRRRLGSTGDISIFEYRNTEAAIMELDFTSPLDRTKMSGWGLCLELKSKEDGKKGPLLLALAYGPSRRQDLQILHFSVLDSIAPSEADRRFPGPVTEFGYPRETRSLMPLFLLGEEAWFFEEDEAANQALIDREFEILKRYIDSIYWKEAWIRYYRAIYRDSCERLSNAAFVAERKLNVPEREKLDFASQVLDWIQRFHYERVLEGSDFINLISCIRDGRGDCDNFSMLYALILNQANIPAAMMVSREYSHAMALADLGGEGARFSFSGKKWLVAETTARVGIGLIVQDFSDISGWIGVILE